MKIVLLILAAVAGIAFGQTLVTSTTARANKAVSLVAGDHFVCGINPSAYTVSAPGVVFDFTVPVNKTFGGNISINGILR